MNFKIDHDYHIHTKLSSCSRDENQTMERILRYAEDNGFKKICFTDHFWDENVPCFNEWYRPQNYAHIASNLPLPESEGVKVCFGCETELDKNFTLGISEKTMEKLDFIIIPTTHLHFPGFTVDENKVSIEERADIYIKRLDRVLSMDLPFSKTGIAHLTCDLIASNTWSDWNEHIKIIDIIPDSTFAELFSKMAKVGAGFELNLKYERYSAEQKERVLRPYRIAKQAGCKFYLGSDAHHPEELDIAFEKFTNIVSDLGLSEEDKFEF